MRNNIMAAIVVSFGLAACSGSSSQTVTGGSQVAPLSHSAPHFVAAGFQRDQSCGSQYSFCYTIGRGKTVEEVCIITSSQSCSSGSLPPYSWGSEITNLDGKKIRHIKASFHPNPGNPTDDTFRAKRVHSSHGNVKYVQHLTACPYPSGSSCIDATIGLITTK